MVEILYFLYTLTQFANLYYYYKPKQVLDKEIYEYKLFDINHTANIYKTNTGSKKIILFLSGSYNVIYDVYIKKTIDDLYKCNKNIVRDYEIIVFEKPNKSTLTIYDDIVNYLRNLYKTVNFESLTIVGFSYGGVIASHVMTYITDIVCTKKIITYDTPLNVIDNVLSFQKNWLYRLDIMYYNVVYNAYINNYNYNDIKPFLQLDASNNWFGLFGGYNMVNLIKNVNKCGFSFIHYVTGFRYDLEPDVHVINIYCDRDPVVNRKINDNYFNKNQDKIACKITNIKKDCIGHCSDMSFDSLYIIDIINAINM